MILLAGSIFLSSYLTLSFKVLERYGINSFHAIVINYVTCVVTGSVVNGSHPFRASLFQAPWLAWALLMGLLFISIFNVIGITTQKAGVSVASVANKLSLVIPFVFSVILYHEPAGPWKIAGLMLALPAVIWVSQRNSVSTKRVTVNSSVNWLPPVLFIGSGLLDTLIKYVENRFLDGSNNNDFLISAFAAAAILGLGWMFVQYVFEGKKISWKAVLAGVLIGVPNYFSIWCLLQVLKAHSGNSSAIIPVNNMGIVAVSTLAAAMIFHEKLSGKNWLGMLLSLVAIALIAFG